MHTQNHTFMLKILWSMPEFGGLWKHPNNPAFTESVRVIQMLKPDRRYKEEEEEEEEEEER